MPAEQPSVRDDLINRMLGEELRRAREAARLTRAQLISRMTSDIHPQTLASYETGVRQCSIPRLEELCGALGVEAPELLALALQRARAEPFRRTLRVDLPALLRDGSAPFDPVRTWARNRLESGDGSDVVRLEPAAVREMAFMAGVPHLELIDYLTTFTPAAAPRGRGGAGQ